MDKLTKVDIEYILECLNDYQDEGPVDDGWRSDKLIELIDKLESIANNETN